ncbi:MAG: OB-fold domain-containing protein [Acidimicrobiia bacterium]|nr:OB-fold domain-containing protein [Acidimicrobiia bacterium]
MTGSEVPPIDLPDLDVSAIEAIEGVEPVRSVRTPIRLDYRYVPGRAAVTYLEAMAEKRILGQRDPDTGHVFVPPRGVNPASGRVLDEFVELPDRGHVGSFCITNVPIPGRDDLSLPYASCWIFLDGADIGFLGLVAGCDPDEVRLGMRVAAKWKPDDELTASAENIRWWEPTGEPDMPLDEIRGGRGA